MVAGASPGLGAVMKSSAKIVIVGGGFGGLFTALNLDDYDVTLVTIEDHFLFTPLLFEYLSGEVEAWHIAPQYRELFEDGSVRTINSQVNAIDMEHQHVMCANGLLLPYDVLVLAVGSVTNYWNVNGASEYAMPFRTLAHADALRQRLMDCVERLADSAGGPDQQATFVVVGAGASGVELSTKISDLLRNSFRERKIEGAPRIVLLEQGPRILPEMDEKIRRYALKAIAEAGIEAIIEAKALEVSPSGIIYEHRGSKISVNAAAVVWTGGVRVSPLVESLDLEKDHRKLIAVEPTLRVRGRERIFALGDIALFPKVNPKLAGTAQLAYQQAKLAASNVRRLLDGKPLKTTAFKELGKAVGLGTRNAAISAGKTAFEGELARQARFLMYTTRLPTWHHRLRVGADWFLHARRPRALTKAT
jgi:demethylphylloquinone reductase